MWKDERIVNSLGHRQVLARIWWKVPEWGDFDKCYKAVLDQQLRGISGIYTAQCLLSIYQDKIIPDTQTPNGYASSLAGYYHWHEQTTNLKTETYLTDATTTVSKMMSLMSGQKEITWCGTHINYVVLLLLMVLMFHVNFTVWKLSNPNWRIVHKTTGLISPMLMLRKTKTVKDCLRLTRQNQYSV